MMEEEEENCQVLITSPLNDGAVIKKNDETWEYKKSPCTTRNKANMKDHVLKLITGNLFDC